MNARNLEHPALMSASERAGADEEDVEGGEETTGVTGVVVVVELHGTQDVISSPSVLAPSLSPSVSTNIGQSPDVTGGIGLEGDGGLEDVDGGLLGVDGGLLVVDGGLLGVDGGLLDVDGGLLGDDGGLLGVDEVGVEVVLELHGTKDVISSPSGMPPSLSPSVSTSIIHSPDVTGGAGLAVDVAFEDETWASDGALAAIKQITRIGICICIFDNYMDC
jgi:hypothetical protein